MNLNLDTAPKAKLLWALGLALAAVGALQIVSLLRFQPPGMDFLPLWTAGRMALSEPGRVYDFAAVTHAQAWLLPPHFAWMRPFAYPPTALLVLAPLGALPFWAALTVWLTAGLAAFLYAGARLAGERPGLAVLLMAFSPAVVLALVAGQSVLLAAGLAAAALAELQQRPRVAGVLLALAAAIKPQALVLAPVALLAGGAVETLIAAGVVGLALIAASAALFGPARWSEWWASLPAFQAVIEGVPRFALGLITPGGVVRELGITGWPALVWRGGFAVAGAIMVWLAFARRASLPLRLAALFAGGLFAAPYALCYDGALLVPAAVALAVKGMDEPGWGLRLGALVAVCAVTAPGVGFLAVAAFAVLAGLRTAPRDAVSIGAVSLAT